MRADPLVYRPDSGRVRVLRDGAAAGRELPPARGRGDHRPRPLSRPFGFRSLAAGRWRAFGERGERAPAFESDIGPDYITAMKHLIAPLLGLAIVAQPAHALAGAGNFTLVNRTGANISSLQIRRVGTGAWQPLGG